MLVSRLLPVSVYTREENAQIKAGKGDELWNDKPHKKRHKDIDTRWVKKNDEPFYGYKNHAKVDTKSRLIDRYLVTNASVHDSQPLDGLLNPNDEGQNLHADSAYTGEPCLLIMKKHKVVGHINEKGHKNKALTDEQKATNREKSKIRARVEHVFGFMEQSMNGLRLKSVGVVRASRIIGLIN